MILRQLLHTEPVIAASYIVGCAGSVCARALSGNPTSTIGLERRFNRTFVIDSESEFVAAMLRDIPPAPPDAAATRARNLGTPLVAV